MYAQGEGVPQDYVQAYARFNVATAVGYENAAKFRDGVIKRISSSQLEEAQKLSKELWEKYGKK